MDVQVNHNNDLVTASLLKSRIRLVAFYKRTDFFLFGEPQRPVVDHYTFEPDQMTLEVSAYLQPQSIQPGFEEFLRSTSLRFLRGPMPGLYQRKLVDTDVELWVRFYNRLRVQVGYKITVTPAPVISYVDTTQKDKTALAKHVDEFIWRSILRAHRIKGISKSNAF